MERKSHTVCNSWHKPATHGLEMLLGEPMDRGSGARSSSWLRGRRQAEAACRARRAGRADWTEGKGWWRRQLRLTPPLESDGYPVSMQSVHPNSELPSNMISKNIWIDFKL